VILIVLGRPGEEKKEEKKSLVPIAKYEKAVISTNSFHVNSCEKDKETPYPMLNL
jgi:hypothetical protein